MTPKVDWVTVKPRVKVIVRSCVTLFQDLGGNLRIEAGSRFLAATTDRRVVIDAESRDGMRSEFLIERASKLIGMLKAKTHGNQNTSECVQYSKLQWTWNIIHEPDKNICWAGSQFIILIQKSKCSDFWLYIKSLSKLYWAYIVENVQWRNSFTSWQICLFALFLRLEIKYSFHVCALGTQGTCFILQSWKIGMLFNQFRKAKERLWKLRSTKTVQ